MGVGRGEDAENGCLQVLRTCKQPFSAIFPLPQGRERGNGDLRNATGVDNSPKTVDNQDFHVDKMAKLARKCVHNPVHNPGLKPLSGG
jgi:hypothetical protein